MGKAVIGNLTIDDLTDDEVDAIRRGIQDIIDSEKGNAWLGYETDAGTIAVWVSAATPMQLEYDAVPDGAELTELLPKWE